MNLPVRRTDNSRPRWTPATVLIGLLWALAANAYGQEDGITVDAAGTATLPPTTMIIRVIAHGDAEVASDALAQFNSARARASEAFSKIGIPGLQVRGEGAKIEAGLGGDVNQMVMLGMGGGDTPAPVVRVQITEVLRLEVSGIHEQEAALRTETAARLLDSARDAGLRLVSDSQAFRAATMLWSGNGMVPAPTDALISFIPHEPLAGEATAFKAAMKDAKEKALALAKLSDRTLGPVRSINLLTRTERADLNTQDVRIEVTLRVQYEFAP